MLLPLQVVIQHFRRRDAAQRERSPDLHEFVRNSRYRRKCAFRRSISVKRLASEEMIMFPRAIAPALFDEILGFCRTAGFTLRIAQEARQTQTIISLVSAGLGIAIVPASIRHLKRKGVVYRSFKEKTPVVRVIA